MEIAFAIGGTTFARPTDIWEEIIKAGEAPGLTSAPMLMPINTRIIMLQSGMRAPMGIKVYGPDLATIEAFGLELEGLLREVRGVRPETVFADRVVGKPYIEIDIDREAIGRYGLDDSPRAGCDPSGPGRAHAHHARSRVGSDTRSACATCARSETASRRSAGCSCPRRAANRFPWSNSPRFGT